MKCRMHNAHTDKRDTIKLNWSRVDVAVGIELDWMLTNGVKDCGF